MLVNSFTCETNITLFYVKIKNKNKKLSIPCQFSAIVITIFIANKVFAFRYSLRFCLTIIRFLQTEHRDTYDCINVYEQPSLKHPSLRNHRFQVHIFTLLICV